MSEWFERWSQQLQWTGAALGLGALATFLAIGFTPGGLAPRSVHPVAVLVVLVAIGGLLAWWAVQADRRLFFIVMLGMVAKAGGTFLRVELTADAGDAQFYNAVGIRIAELLFEGTLEENDPRIANRGTGTNNLASLVGRLYHLLGPNINIAFIVFSFFSFVGSLLIFRAVSEGIPSIDRTRYAMLLFLLPSMLFWPSTLGKDTFMVLSIGVAVYGAVRVITSGSLIGALLTAAGILMAGWIRPHVAALLTLCVVVSVLWPEFRRGGSSRLRQFVLAGAGIAMLIVVLGQVSRFFGTDGIDLGAVLDETEATTSQGGSQFSGRRATDPLGLLLGIPSVLLRPFPHETETVMQLATSFEGVGVLGLAATSWRRLRALPKWFVANPLVRFAVVYLMGFIVTFSVISNFGILARQRVQMWPIFLLLLCLPAAGPTPDAIGSATRRPVGAAQSGP